MGRTGAEALSLKWTRGARGGLQRVSCRFSGRESGWVCGWPGLGLGVWGRKAGRGRPVGAWSQAQVSVRPFQEAPDNPFRGRRVLGRDLLLASEV